MYCVVVEAKNEEETNVQVYAYKNDFGGLLPKSMSFQTETLTKHISAWKSYVEGKDQKLLPMVYL